METRELLKHALTLSDSERAELASTLIDSLDPTVDPDAELAGSKRSHAASTRLKPVRWRRFLGKWSGVRAVTY
jgi:hypothetical protein